MSGAASIAAAKNRRTKPDPNQKPIISCSSLKPGSCPLPQGKGDTKAGSTIFDRESLQITGPMPLAQALMIHEKRLNNIDDKLNQQSFAAQGCMTTTISETSQACDEECYDRISILEEKVQMLEEVIMNLQLTLTNVQSFAMETSLAMLKIQNQYQSTTTTPPSPLAADVPALVSATPVSATPVSATPVTLQITEPATEN
jgi:hypothetical protein